MKKGVIANTSLFNSNKGDTNTIRSFLIFIPSMKFPNSLLKFLTNDFSFKDFLFILSFTKIARGTPIRYKAVKKSYAN
jgi:hypothetical protein